VHGRSATHYFQKSSLTSSSYVEISIGYGRYREEASDWDWDHHRHVIQKSVTWKFTCHSHCHCQRTQYAGVSTDECTVRVKFLHWWSRQASWCIITRLLVISATPQRCPSLSPHQYAVWVLRPYQDVSCTAAGLCCVVGYRVSSAAQDMQTL